MQIFRQGAHWIGFEGKEKNRLSVVALNEYAVGSGYS